MKRIKMLPVVLFIVALVIQPLYAFASTISKAGEETNHLVQAA
ncbi:hypothetical protein [Desulforamulus aeronauticus]|uniref:Uncharacterized protein n=1 Tax=Desulforamulus aeronauticus DSM 10349 TaxID=1121421 RepID=A0A1M6QHQ3_9FIRM|nr:hypothetical protein [Desulforamulus aeronauticus]SHK19547.1 hypothetical protein SAMN02745123_01049 [Desulforamulus aeronauticus DSM 10349]